MQCRAILLQELLGPVREDRSAYSAEQRLDFRQVRMGYGLLRGEGCDLGQLYHGEISTHAFSGILARGPGSGISIGAL